MTPLLINPSYGIWGLITLGERNTSRDIKNLEDWRKIL